MTPDSLNAPGVFITRVGSGVAMVGIFKQTNAYYPFKAKDFLKHLYSIAKRYLSDGDAAVLKEIHTTAKLGENRGEDRTQSLVGLYYVFLGFLIQLTPLRLNPQ